MPRSSGASSPFGRSALRRGYDLDSARIERKYETHHGVRIKDAALVAAATLSNRYISDRFLPDKAIDLVDEAAAKLRTEIDSMPQELDEVSRRIMQLEIEREALRKETTTPAAQRSIRSKKNWPSCAKTKPSLKHSGRRKRTPR